MSKTKYSWISAVKLICPPPKVSPHLAKVMMINDFDEVAPRYNWREIFASVFDGVTPRASLADYERWSEKKRVRASDRPNEIKQLDDEGPNVA